jgi:acyl-homoserine lactone acylase PvdQ
MVKLAIGAVLFATTATVSWSGFRAVNTPRAESPQATASDPLASDAAYRHRQALPNHWRGYLLQQRGF